MGYDPVGSDLLQLLLNGKRLKLSKRQLATTFGDNTKLNLIKTGYIQRYLITKDGSRNIQAFFGPNDIFPLIPVFKNAYKMDVYSGLEQYYFETVNETEIFWISQETLWEAQGNNPMIFRDLLYHAGLRLNLYTHRLEDIALKDSYRRVAYLLAFYSERFFEKTPKGIKILMPRSQQQIADMLSLRRETVNRMITRLKKKGIVYPGSYFIVPDLDRLKSVYL